MIWFPFKKKRYLTISEDVKDRIAEESKKLGKPQVLILTLKHDDFGVGSVLVGFSDRIESDSGMISWTNPSDAILLSFGELKFDSGHFYFYPNIDLEWKKTPKPEIHKIISNYPFSKKPIYLERNEFFQLRPILSNCFQREGVTSVYLENNICQLEIQNLTAEKEKRISENILTYLSSLFESPLVK